MSLITPQRIQQTDVKPTYLAIYFFFFFYYE